MYELQQDWMRRGGKPEGAAELHPGLGPGSPHRASVGLGRPGRAGMDPSSYMSPCCCTPSQALLKTRTLFCIYAVWLGGTWIPSSKCGTLKSQIWGGKGIGKGISSQADGAPGGHVQKGRCTNNPWHRECHLQWHSISHHCSVMFFIIILLTIFSLLRKTTIFTAFAFYRWNMTVQLTFIWACKRRLHRWEGVELMFEALSGVSG